jgi:hypothetical protein
MTFSNYRVERLVFVFLLCIALLMAFVPLVRIHDPNGTRVNSALDLPAGMSQLQSELRIVTPIKASVYNSPANTPAAAAAATPGSLPMPFSIRSAALVPWCIFAALAFAFLALVDLLFFDKAVAVLSLLGGILGAAALIHVLILSSDLQAWSDALMSINELSAPSDPAFNVRSLMANSFFLIPGVGLYVLATSLLLMPFLSITSAVPRVGAVVRSAARIRSSNPVQIRPVNSKYPAETCMTLDVSRTGLLLESPSNRYFVGMEVYLTRNAPTGGAGNSEEHGYVVRVEKKDSGCRFAIHLIPEPK